MRSLLLAATTALLALPATAAGPAWHTDFQAAQAVARAEDKPLLVLYTGPGWCPYCVLLEKEVLEGPVFAEFAKGYVAVKLEFPPQSRRSPEHLKADPGLARRMDLKTAHQVTGFPTVLILDAEGRERARKVSYAKGAGAQAYLADLEASRKP